MNTESVEMILNSLEKVGQKLGLTADYLWPALIRQQYIDSVFSALILILSIVALAKGISFATKHWHPDSDKKTYSIYKNDHEGFWIGALIVLGVFSIIGFIWFCCDFQDIFNPTYGALKDITSMLKSNSCN